MRKDLIKKYENVIKETDRFYKKAKIALQEIREDEHFYQSKNNASAKRASMDLTRALAELRKY